MSNLIGFEPGDAFMRVNRYVNAYRDANTRTRELLEPISERLR